MSLIAYTGVLIHTHVNCVLPADGAPVVPISAQLRYNVDVVCEYIEKRIPVPQRDFISPPQMIVIRSFDVNKPGSEVDELKGGVAGGSILQGVLRMGQEIEVSWGYQSLLLLEVLARGDWCGDCYMWEQDSQRWIS